MRPVTFRFEMLPSLRAIRVESSPRLPGVTSVMIMPGLRTASDQLTRRALSRLAASKDWDKAKAGDGYFGYRFRILRGQGNNIAGGRYDYVINGNMIAGFALIVYLSTHGFDRAVLLSNYDAPSSRAYLAWLKKRTKVPLMLRSVSENTPPCQSSR